MDIKLQVGVAANSSRRSNGWRGSRTGRRWCRSSATARNPSAPAAARYCPRGAEGPHLADHIKITIVKTTGRDEPMVGIGVPKEFFYDYFLEYGTGHSPGSPVLPAGTRRGPSGRAGRHRPGRLDGDRSRAALTGPNHRQPHGLPSCP